MDYQPLDLAEHYNAGTAWFGRVGENDSAPLLGNQALRGLPFQLGEDVARNVLAFGEGGRESTLILPIRQPIRGLIVAHRLRRTAIFDGGPLAEPVADYVIRYRDGAVDCQPIRDRFEISIIPTRWGQLPFRSVPDRSDWLPSRYEGRWGEAGERQSEAEQAWPRDWFLWAWVNPRPNDVIEAVEIVPRGLPFGIGGITLSHVDEFPFVREGARPVTIELLDPANARQHFNLAVEVDRGTTTFPYALPNEPAETFLGDSFAGFGETNSDMSAAAYVEVAALPSATLTVKQAGEPIGEVRWGDLVERGSVTTEPPAPHRLRIEVTDPGRNWVRTRIVDDATGRPIPGRVHFRSPRGIPFQPHGHHTHVNGNLGTWHVDIGGDLRLGQISYAYVDGTCEGWLPRGEVIVDVARGFEYEPVRQRITIAPGQQTLELRLKRWRDMNAQRWFSGDTHVHFLSTQGSHLEAGGEDLNVVNLLLSQWGHLFTNTEEFIGRPAVSRQGQTIVYATQENRQHFLGHLTLLGLKEMVMPWCSDGPSEAEMGGTLEDTLSTWADRCRAQGGTVVLPHLPAPNGEPAALVATKRVDAVEMLQHNPYNHLEYYRYLNCGYRLPLVGGTDKMTSDVPVGLYRTYVKIPADQEFTYDTWCANLRAGRTFLSGGPLISLTVDGRGIGDTLELPGNGGTVEVEATVESIFPVHVLEIVQQGRVVASTADSKGTKRLAVKTRLPITGHTWLAARAGGPGYNQPVLHHDCWSRGIMAHTSPVYVSTGGDWQLFDRDAAQYMLTLVDGSLSYIRELAPRYAPGAVTHHHGEADHQAYLERPFLEAQAALHRRLHELGVAH
jgi:hypothetical protein